jgi:sulfate adenylyltransferase
VDLLVPAERASELESDIASGTIALSWTLTMRQACDAELLLSGGFTPLDGFMGPATYASVLARTRLDEAYGNALWPMPITLDVPSAFVEAQPELVRLLQQQEEGASSVVAGKGSGNVGVRLALRDAYHNLIAVMTVTSAFVPDKRAEAKAVFGTTDAAHPGVAYLFETAGQVYLGGRLEGVALPKHFDFPQLRLTPAQVRAQIVERGWPRTVAFQTRNPMHRAHIELTKRASNEAHAGLLLQPSVGMTKPGDVEASVRVRCYQAVAASGRYYGPGGVLLALLPLAMRMAGPKEALWHAIIRKNHGASHFIVGRDHAGCKDAAGRDFYGAYDAQALVGQHAAELGITMMKYTEVEYVPRLDQYIPGDQVRGAQWRDRCCDTAPLSVCPPRAPGIARRPGCCCFPLLSSSCCCPSLALLYRSLRARRPSPSPAPSSVA